MYRILIIENDSMTAKIVKDALNIHDIKADIAEDGEKGLNLIRKREYDLILLDLRMPGISGEDVLREIKKNTSVYLCNNLYKFQ